MDASGLAPLKRALISVSDKTGLAERAAKLADAGVELLSTGGTLQALRDAGLEARDVSSVTEYPEMMDGRVKTLHPRIHGGLLARRDNEDDLAAMAEHGIPQIDLLVVNLYPFEETARSGADIDACIQKIDVGGPAMIRAAAKNHNHVAVCTDMRDLDKVLEVMAEHHGQTTLAMRRHLAGKAFARTAAYDSAIAARFEPEVEKPAHSWFTIGGPRLEKLRYGENPHQDAALYQAPEQRPGVVSARQIQGKALSYNNIADADAAFELVSEFDPEERAAAVIIKHANPCGAAAADDLATAYERAFKAIRFQRSAASPPSTARSTRKTADAITKIFTEVVIAPDADPKRRWISCHAKKNVRVLLTGALADPDPGGLDAPRRWPAACWCRNAIPGMC
jgi:phosphoribosylaminoimidazolecarboxamide formyltransferase/IMP cyclohydrolase